MFQLLVREASYPIKNETFYVNRLGLEYKTMDISFIEPTEHNVQTFFEVMDDYSDKTIFVHCAVGYCTSGLTVMYLMQRQGMTYEQAKSKIGDWEPNPAWKKLIQDVTGHIYAT